MKTDHLDDGLRKMARENAQQTIHFLDQHTHDLIDWTAPVSLIDTKIILGKLGSHSKEIDFAIKVTLKDGKTVIVHVEFQTKYDPKMQKRMNGYRVFVVEETGVKRIIQIVVYVDKIPLNADHTYRYVSPDGKTSYIATTYVVQ